MKTFKKQTTDFILQFGGNIQLAKSEINKLIDFYRLTDENKMIELIEIKQDLI